MADSRTPPSAARGQLVAIAASIVVLAVQLWLRPIFGHSVYLLCAPALLASLWLGGWLAGVSVTILTVGAGFVLDLGGSAGLTHQVVEPATFMGIGLLASEGFRRLEDERRRTLDLVRRQRRREALLQAGLDIVADALVVTEADGQIHMFSNAAERLFGWKADDMIGQSFSRLMPPGEDAALSDADGEDVSGSIRQVTGLRRDGSTFPMELQIAEVRADASRFLAMVVRDLTSTQEAERRSEELRAQLTQLWSANSMGEMASVLAHELNQPLSAVANYLRAARNIIARMELEDDDLIDAVARAGDQAVRAGEIVRTMRDLATRGGTLQKPESLSAIIREVDFIIALMARDANVRVVYDLYKGDDTVMADRIQIQQLVVNLARNAIEAVTKYPNRQLNISTKLDSANQLITSVEDSGPGIDPSVTDRLFQPLASTKPEGMGLGLSISSAIVENHRGRIWVEPSRLGGAAFCFALARAGEDGGDNGREDGVRRR
ncbi:two-component system sensor histidine kinase NtrB [Phenylobacterium kunshanense]|uniref:two-component system sensor histidine kinase NtrB n=1 Tax=Phenylobacterium kunshanense TaxID=1445034 RepID=UPI0014022F2C|nr:ATP-binding protein [Phenylobacterium kunshanense]